MGQSPLSLEALLAKLGPSARVLDLGCGGGTFRYSDYPGLSITGIDESLHPKALQFPPNAKFIRAGASSIPAASSSFDLIIVNFAFEHFPDPAAALIEIERVAREHAYVWISIPNAASFEDQLYRNLFAGGGHLQSPSLERFLRWVYQCTCLKLISFVEIPAGFTFLGESEELRHLTWAIVDALKKSVAIDASARSGFIFILRKETAEGTGYREFARTCRNCGTPDSGTGDTATEEPEEPSKGWKCSSCGALNRHPSTLQAISLDSVEKALRLQWQRLPETHPAELKKMLDERGQWAQQLQKDAERIRSQNEDLAKELDQRGRWGLSLQKDLETERENYRALSERNRLELNEKDHRIEEVQRENSNLARTLAELQAEFDARGIWALELDRERIQLRDKVENLERTLSEMRRPLGWLRHNWIRMRHRSRNRTEPD